MARAPAHARVTSRRADPGFSEDRSAEVASQIDGRTPSELPGPGEPTPLTPAAQVISVDSISRAALKKRGLPVSVAAAGATTVTLTLLNKGKVLATRTIGDQGGDTRLRTNRAVQGKLVVRVTATGAGGRASDSTGVRTTR